MHLEDEAEYDPCIAGERGRGVGGVAAFAALLLGCGVIMGIVGDATA